MRFGFKNTWIVQYKSMNILAILWIIAFGWLWNFGPLHIEVQHWSPSGQGHAFLFMPHCPMQFNNIKRPCCFVLHLFLVTQVIVGGVIFHVHCTYAPCSSITLNVKDLSYIMNTCESSRKTSILDLVDLFHVLSYVP